MSIHCLLLDALLIPLPEHYHPKVFYSRDFIFPVNHLSKAFIISERPGRRLFSLSTQTLDLAK